MKFKTIQEAFNYYRNHKRDQLEQRADEIRTEVRADENADVESFNIEIEGIMQVIQDQDDNGGDDNIEGRAQLLNSLNPILANQRGNLEPQKEVRDVFATNEYRNAFFKKLTGKKLNQAEEKAYKRAGEQKSTETRDALTSDDAGAVLPTETLNEVITEARRKGGLLNEVRAFNMPSGIKIPIGTPTDRAEWHKEGEKVDPDNVELSYVKFDGYEIVKVFSISVKVKTMSISAFESYLVEELSNAVMQTIAHALVNGDGDEKGEGLDASIDWTEDNQVTGDGEYTDITDALGMLKRGYASNAKFAMNTATLYKHVYGMVDGNGRPLFTADQQTDNVGRILGKQVIVDDFIEDDTIILGDFNYMAYNLPLGITVESSRESSFRSALIDYRAVAVADTKPLIKDAFVKITFDEAAQEPQE